jgi:hypothetical protein
MKNIDAACIVCEDIREEISGQATIIGVLPDNLAMPGFLSLAPKFGIVEKILRKKYSAT